MKAADSVDGKRDCYAGLKSCAQARPCDTEMCDSMMAGCLEKATPKQKENLKCEKQWKKCYIKNRKQMCHKKAHDEYGPPPPPPGPPGGDEPPTQGPPTEAPPTEVPPTETPVTEAPATKKPHKGANCIGKWKKCMKAADSVDGKRDCYAGLKSCAQARPCDTEMCDSMMAGCLEKATPKQKENLKCEKQWKKCYIKNRKQMCHKKGPHDEIDGPPTDERGPYDEIEGPPTDFPPVETEEPFPPTEQPTEEPITEKPKPEKPQCIGKWKKCMRAADSVDGKRECYAGLKSCAQARPCDTEMCDSPMTACLEKATPKQKENLKCEKQWKKCYKENRKQMCHKKGF